MDKAAAQRALIALGYDLGTGGATGKGDDGLWGKRSVAACISFQGKNGLPATGILTPETMKALQAAVAEKAEPRTAPTANLLTPAIIRAIAPGARQDIMDALVSSPDRFAAAGITTPRLMAHFLSEVATETGGFTKLEESLNYSVDGLMKTFSRARISAAQCQALGRALGRPAQQEQIANIIYGGAWGAKNLGNTQPGDGWRYRGGGDLQTTGRTNYRRAGFEANPEALRQPAGALTAALKFWTDNDLNRIAATGTVAQVRKVINGGTNGIAEAQAYFAKACKALGI
jgi:putative chitinase